VLETAQELFASLSPAQRARAMVAGDDAPRGDERGPRSGLPIRDLDGHQQGLVHALIDDFTSPSGLALCEQIASQAGADGLGHYLLAFMDPPSASAPWSWRVSEQHLTLVDSERDDGQPATVGPVLLGTNPPVGFEAWEDRLIALYSTLSPDDRAKVCLVGKADSGAPIAGAGALVGGLSAAAQAKVDEVVEQRLAFFAPPIAQRMRALLVAQGGAAGLRLAFWGSADKRCADGGKWDWKLGSEKVLIDYENNRGHIHTTLKASP
nr:DUF3500 domain-containing protein [Planctomycetota bacterium]